MKFVEALWHAEGQPKVMRSWDDRLAERFWSSTPVNGRRYCQHQIWNESRGARGPWCGYPPCHGSAYCHHHGGASRRTATKALIAERRVAGPTIEAEIGRIGRLVATAKLVADACINLSTNENRKREAHDL